MSSPRTQRAQAERLVGSSLADGKYRLEELVGAGGMGAVYRATQEPLQRTVAVKVLHADLAERPEAEARFLREARAASRISHPNALQVLDFGADQGQLYLVMEYLRGGDLGDLLRTQPVLAEERIVRLMAQTLAALAVAHDQGVVHRDLKPDNILVFEDVDDDGRPVERVKVCDFGIAKILARDGSGDSPPTITETGQIHGTPDYMSPEQAMGRSLDARSDLYSCGVVLFRMATGQALFKAESLVGVLMQHITTAPPRPRELRPELSPWLEEIILRCLAKEPAARFGSARELRAALLGRNTVSAPALGPAGDTPLHGPPPALPEGGLAQEGALAAVSSTPATPPRAAAASGSSPQAVPSAGRAEGDGPIAKTSTSRARLALVAAAALVVGIGLVAFGLWRQRTAGDGGLPVVPAGPSAPSPGASSSAPLPDAPPAAPAPLPPPARRAPRPPPAGGGATAATDEARAASGPTRRT